MNAKRNPIRILIVILAVLLALSIAALVGLLLYRRGAPSPAVAPDNIITTDATSAATEATSEQPVPSESVSESVADESVDVSLRIYRSHTEDGTPFRTGNLFPGDRETKTYSLEVSHSGSVTLHFRADVRNGYETLAEVLKCRVCVDGAPLYDGLLRDVSLSRALPDIGGATETLRYEITVYLDTDVGNEYMAKELYADFQWWVTESEQLIPPLTGDTMHFCIWFWIAMASLLLNLILLGAKLREKGGKQTNAQKDR